MPVRKQLEKIKSVDIDVDALIDKGAPVKSDKVPADAEKKNDTDEKPSESEWTHLNLRLPKTMLKQIDECLKARIGMPRSVWLLEALQEKLKRCENE